MTSTPQPDAAETAAEVKRRFTERSLLLCGAEFLSTRRCLEPVGRSLQAPNCDGRKQALMQCMQSRVCEVLYGRLQQCTAAHSDPAQCAQQREGLNRCLQAGYVSLPEPDESIEIVEARMRALGASRIVTP
mmetsp:Transcript_8514/g.17136  ORF Transcript_8514/g.17136 Transcript_8514/m.17136 type:complete len:131 (-) Transcript_8514:94-486(-)